MLTGYYCPTRKRYKRYPERQYKIRTKLPENHRDFNKKEYYQKTFDVAHSYHFYAHNLQIEDVRLRRIVTDAMYDALENKHGKIHKKEYVNEYEKFNRYFDEHFRQHIDISEWETYRSSDEYQTLRRTVQEIEDYTPRARIMIDNALAYAYSKYQKGYKAGVVLADIEKTLKLDTIQKIWSKKTFWFLTTFLVFDANNLYAATIGNNQTVMYDYDPYSDAIKIHTIPWYERKTVEAPEWFKWGAKIYQNIIIPIAGELGSVALAEAARLGTCHALLHAARLLSGIAKFHPALRAASLGAEALNFLRGVLDNTVIAWLGWQIAVEWPLDGYIQAGMNYALKFIYSLATGIDMHWLGKGGMQDFTNAIKVLEKYYKYGEITTEEKALLEKVRTEGTPKMKEILERIEKSLKGIQQLQHFRTYQDFYSRTINRNITHNAFTYAISQNSKVLKKNTGDALFYSWVYNYTAVPAMITGAVLLGQGNENIATRAIRLAQEKIDYLLALNWKTLKQNRQWVYLDYVIEEDLWPDLYRFAYREYIPIGSFLDLSQEGKTIRELKPLKVTLNFFTWQGGREIIYVETYVGYDWEDIERQWITRHNFPFFSILNFSHLFYIVRKHRSIKSKYPYAYTVIEETRRLIPLKITRKWRCFAVVRNKKKKKVILHGFFEPYTNTYKIKVMVDKDLWWGKVARFSYWNMRIPVQRDASGSFWANLIIQETFWLYPTWNIEKTWGYMKWSNDSWGGGEKQLLRLRVEANKYRSYIYWYDEIKEGIIQEIQKRNIQQEGVYTCDIEFYYPGTKKEKRKSKRSKLICVPRER